MLIKDDVPQHSAASSKVQGVISRGRRASLGLSTAYWLSVGLSWLQYVQLTCRCRSRLAGQAIAERWLTQELSCVALCLIPTDLTVTAAQRFVRPRSVPEKEGTAANDFDLFSKRRFVRASVLKAP